MLNKEWIRKTEEFLRHKFDESVYLTSHPEEKAYRLEHTYRVANIGRQIAREEGYDETEMVIACLLHDISYCEAYGEDGFWPEWKDHGRAAARIARPFLEELGMAEDRIQDICYGIAIHVDYESDFPGEKTPFALSVCEADNLDRVDVYRIHETLSNDGFLSMNYEEKLAYAQQHLAKLRGWEKMPLMVSGASQRIWKTRIAFSIEFFGKLVSQLRNSRDITE